MDTSTYQRIQKVDFSRLRPVDALVPTDAMFAQWHSSKTAPTSIQVRHQTDETMGDNVILNAYMQCVGIRSLHPDTLLPIGVLVLLYNTVFHNEPGRHGTHHPVVQLALQQGLIVQEPDGLVPFAVVLGRDVIEYTLGHQ